MYVHVERKNTYTYMRSTGFGFSRLLSALAEFALVTFSHQSVVIPCSIATPWTVFVCRNDRRQDTGEVVLPVDK